MALALPIKKGELCCFIRCQCGGNYFFPQDWPETRGLTSQQARARGLTIITVAN